MSRENTEGLDALFSFADDPEPEPEPAPVPVEQGPPSLVWPIVRNVLLLVVATVVTLMLLRMARVEIPVLIVVSLFVALRLIMWAVAAVSPPPPPRVEGRRRGEEPGSYRWSGNDSLRSSVGRWERRLEWSHSDGDRFSRNVLPVLAELTDERLRLRHGITRASDPRRARQLIGEPLWRLLEDPGRRPPKRAELAAHVEALERL